MRGTLGSTPSKRLREGAGMGGVFGSCFGHFLTLL